MGFFFKIVTKGSPRLLLGGIYQLFLRHLYLGSNLMELPGFGNTDPILQTLFWNFKMNAI
jgi:hypothetical protein